MHTLKKQIPELLLAVNNETNNATTEQIPKVQSYQANHQGTHPNESLKYQRKSGSSHQMHDRQHYDGQVTSLGSLVGMPVKLSNGIAGKHNNQTYIHKGFLGI